MFSKLNKDIKERKNLLENELTGLEMRLAGLEKPRNLPEKILFFFKRRKVLRRKYILENSFDTELKKPFRRTLKNVEHLKSEIEDRKNNQEEWIELHSASEIRRQESILSVFKKNRYLFYGAEGEEKAERELSKLSDKYVVINDYQQTFSKPIYDKRNEDRIYSIQIDHIVIGPTGIYLIETKNWSKDSMENPDLFSPVKQLCRHNFAMRVILKAIKRKSIGSFLGHWGAKKISPKNILLVMNHKPQHEFQFVSSPCRKLADISRMENQYLMRKK